MAGEKREKKIVSIVNGKFRIRKQQKQNKQNLF